MSLVPAFDIAAHSRFLSAVSMQCDAAKTWLLTAAQDGTMAVWRLPGHEEARQVDMVCSHTWKNNMLVGAAFVHSANKVAVSAYSSDIIRVYDLPMSGA